MSEAHLDFWKFREYLTIDEVTYLALGCDPENCNYLPDGWHALNKVLLEAADPNQYPFDSIAVVDKDAAFSGESLLTVFHLEEWFKSKKLLPPFFFPEETDQQPVATKSKPAYQTRLMSIMYETINRYYGENYDPNDRDSVPLKSVVIDWLRDTYSPSGIEAQAIDMMTRPDHVRKPQGKK